jgi:hypothetical protein
MQLNLKRGFHRIFALLCVVWVVYCLVLYPLQQRQRAERAYGVGMQDCFEHHLNPNEFHDCIQYAEINSGLDLWTLRAYYTRESWFLASVVVAVPILAYGLCRVGVATGRWVLRGFTA